MTEKQKLIMEFLRDYIEENTMPPTIREITENFGFKSPKATQDHIKALTSKGYINREEGIARGIQIITKAFLPKSKDMGIPILGSVAAGSTILAEENLKGFFNFKEMYGKVSDLFALLVRGDSMIFANINDGDYVIVKKNTSVSNGEIGVAIINGEATVKRFSYLKGMIRLSPENNKYKAIMVDPDKENFSVAGRVVGLHRIIK